MTSKASRLVSVVLAAGLVFGIGLSLSGMTRPEKVIAFLDLGGAWDASLAFVMLGAITVHALALRSLRARHQPLAGERFFLPSRTDVDGRLLAGAALFGVGWGLSGYCPGPALSSLVAPQLGSVVFVCTMLLGMALVDRFDRVRRTSSPNT